ncbi:MAG TPA: GntR family transcriptional regulator [Candidatus Limnocylindrales bacterium]|nr:GntR family transcriptional regulator [Candidatus Limnocylindrales bacterium]
MTPLRIQLRPGEPIFDQLVYAAKKAIVSGEIGPGQLFPSVRSLAAGLKVHPNTVHKVIQHLIQEGLLEARPGVGTVVAEPPAARSRERKRILQAEAEQLVIEARRAGLTLPDVLQEIESQWARIDKQWEVIRK